MLEKSPLKNEFKGIPSLPETNNHNRVIKEVLQNFKKKVDWATNQAIDEFLKTYQENLGEEEGREIIKEITSKQAIRAVIHLHRASIELKALKNRLEQADKKCRIAVQNMLLTFVEHEGIDPEGDWDFKPFKLSIVKNPQEEKKAAFQKTYEFIKSMADGSAQIPLESISKRDLPDEIKQLANQLSDIDLEEFLADISQLIIENGDEGKRAIIKMCEDTDAAKQMTTSPDAPAPLKFLAEIITKHVKKPE